MRRGRTGLVFVLAVAGLATAACSVDASSALPTVPVPATRVSAAGPLTAPAGDAVYDPPSPLPAGRPGDVVWARPFAGPDGSQGYVVLYLSSTVDDQPIAVSGVILVPGPAAPPPPPGGRTVLSWAHGTTGLGDACAPSKRYPTGQGGDAAVIQMALGHGDVYAATDYQGLGTSGDHPYVVGRSEGRNVLDIARAAERLEGSGAAATSKVVLWGHSQGGGAAAFAAELAPSYAANLDVVGAVAAAPATELGTLAAARDGGEYAGFAFMAVIGLKAAYPALSYDAILDAAGQRAAAAADTECSGQILKDFAGKRTSDLFTTLPSRAPGWKEALAANNAGQARTPVPIFIYQGDADAVSPLTVSATLLQKYCMVGDTAWRKVYPDADHTTVIAAALPDVTSYLDARVAALPPPSSC